MSTQSAIEVKRAINWEQMKPGDMFEKCACIHYEDLDEDLKNEVKSWGPPPDKNAVNDEVDDNPYGWERVYFRGFETDEKGVKFILFSPVVNECSLYNYSENFQESPGFFLRHKFYELDCAPINTYTDEQGYALVLDGKDVIQVFQH